MSGKITCLVFIEVKEGRAKEQITLYKQIKPMVLAEPGCIEYKLTQVKGSDTRFILIEQWTSKEALAAHDATPHMIDAGSKSPAFRSKPTEVVEIIDV
jgi:quinol monooxygenase YgiN